MTVFLRMLPLCQKMMVHCQSIFSLFWQNLSGDRHRPQQLWSLQLSGHLLHHVVLLCVTSTVLKLLHINLILLLIIITLLLLLLIIPLPVVLGLGQLEVLDRGSSPQAVVEEADADDADHHQCDNQSHQKLNLNSSNELFRPLGDVIDRIVLSGCHIPVEIGTRLSYWVLQEHLPALVPVLDGGGEGDLLPPVVVHPPQSLLLSRNHLICIF